MYFTPEIEVSYILFERCHTKNRKRCLKQHIKYFNFMSKIQLDHPVGTKTYSKVPACKTSEGERHQIKVVANARHGQSIALAGRNAF